MRILFAIKSLHVAGGGAERVLVLLANGLSQRGHSVKVLTFDRPGQQPFYELDAAVELVPLGLGEPGESTPRLALLRRLPTLRSTVRRLSPDVVVGFMHSMYLPLGLALLGSRIPMIASEHQVARYYADRPLERVLLRVSPLLANAITVTSDRIRKSFPDRLQRRMVAIPNPVPTVDDARYDVAERDHVILTVGSLTNQKDQMTLVRAFAEVARDRPQWGLRIVGEGPMRSDIEREVHRRNLDDRVELPGVVTPIDDEYRRAAIFAIPSVFESFGLVTAEALMQATPVVGFADCPGTNELIENDRNGLLVEGEDRVTALADGLRVLMDDPDLRARLGGEGPSTLARFGPEPIVERWEGLLLTTVE